MARQTDFLQHNGYTIKVPTFQRERQALSDLYETSAACLVWMLQIGDCTKMTYELLTNCCACQRYHVTNIAIKPAWSHSEEVP